MALEHGLLNMPGRLAQLDADIDRQIAIQAAQAKAHDKSRAAQFKANKAKASELLAEVGPRIVAQMAPGIAKRMSLSEIKAAREVNNTLDQMAKWEPAKFLVLVERFRVEQSTEIQAEA